MVLPPIDWPFLFVTAAKIFGAYVLSIPTGWWSEKEGHAVGVRTFPLVAMASCGYLLILRNQGGGPDALAASSRVLQGLVAGIGFVGGGAIVKAGMSVRGTATAASIWNMGAIGSAVALERYEVAVVLAVMNLFTMRALVPVKQRLDRNRKARPKDQSEPVKPQAR
ncbi:MAG TPA: MgtC/SapB family protein [Bryobacteraceae bacterium]|nr:MgtC/SapB family protein [Bryobacteraceae bacterium]